MKLISKKALGVAGALVVAGMATPAMAGTGNGDATVKILKAITVTKTATLDFGKVLPGAAAATVAVAENGSRTCGTGLNCYGSTAAGAFGIAGTPGESVSVALDSAQITLSDGASNTMTVDLTTSTSALTLTGGTASFKVAGSLNVGANQADGTYTGTYTVSVNYQ